MKYLKRIFGKFISIIFKRNGDDESGELYSFLLHMKIYSVWDLLNRFVIEKSII